MKTEDGSQGICAQNFVKIGQAVSKIRSRTDRQSDKLIAIRSLNGAE